jgi:hypothetical protein
MPKTRKRRRAVVSKRFQFHGERKGALRLVLALYEALEKHRIPVEGKILAAINNAVRVCARAIAHDEKTRHNKSKVEQNAATEKNRRTI